MTETRPAQGWQAGVVLSTYGGFYTVLLDGTAEQEVCKPRGRLRQSHDGVFAGDRVWVQRVAAGESVIEALEPRQNRLLRPKIVNVGQAVAVLAARDPAYDLLLLDKILLVAGCNGIQPLICINKCDLATEAELAELQTAYRGTGCPLLAVSAATGDGLPALAAALGGTVSVLAGPSGVGKSSLLNRLLPGLDAPTGAISQRLARGKHTTRHVQLLPFGAGGLVADTPGFSLLDLPPQLELAAAPGYYREFQTCGPCRFEGCLHDQEPDCAVKQAVAAGGIDAGRYQRYLRILQEIREREVKY